MNYSANIGNTRLQLCLLRETFNRRLEDCYVSLNQLCAEVAVDLLNKHINSTRYNPLHKYNIQFFNIQDVGGPYRNSPRLPQQQLFLAADWQSSILLLDHVAVECSEGHTRHHCQDSALFIDVQIKRVKATPDNFKFVVLCKCFRYF